MSHALKRKLANYFADHPAINCKALCIYHSLQEVLQLISPPEMEHTKRRNKNSH